MDGIGDKLLRAQEHLATLDQEIDAFFHQKPYVLSGKHNRDGTEYVVKVRFTDDIPTRISVLIGDILYQMRSSLDHVAYSMAEAGSGGSSGSEFPIMMDGNQYRETDPATGDPTPRSGCFKIAGITTPDARAFIEAVQPFSRPEGRRASWPLWGLQTLNNIDKHRVLLTTVFVNSGMWGLPILHDVASSFKIKFPSGIKQNGAVIARYILTVPYADVKMSLVPALTLSFRKVEGVKDLSQTRAIDRLNEMLQLVGWIVAQCRQWT